MSSHVKNFSYAHEYLKLFLRLWRLAEALMETGLRTGGQEEEGSTEKTDRPRISLLLILELFF